jgi:hypothetical protein
MTLVPPRQEADVGGASSICSVGWQILKMTMLRAMLGHHYQAVFPNVS